MEEKIKFRYFRPVISTAITVIWVIITGISAYYLLHNIDTFGFKAFYMLLGIVALPALFTYFTGNDFRDLSGSFIFHNDNFDIKAFGLNENIYFTDITEIRKEFYEKGISLVVVSGTQYNPGKYTVELKNGKKYSFCIAEKEEKTYAKKIKQLDKKIYGTNSLGVHFNTKKFREKMSDREREKRYEREKPATNYSLETAITGLLKKTGMKLNDLTVEEAQADA